MQYLVTGLLGFLLTSRGILSSASCDKGGTLAHVVTKTLFAAHATEATCTLALKLNA